MRAVCDTLCAQIATELTHADEYDGVDDKHFCAFRKCCLLPH
jgi:hypothetical protein